ncbi:hypothetical protein ACHAP8_005457 [Fusarium lateritium]
MDQPASSIPNTRYALRSRQAKTLDSNKKAARKDASQVVPEGLGGPDWTQVLPVSTQSARQSGSKAHTNHDPKARSVSIPHWGQVLPVPAVDVDTSSYEMMLDPDNGQDDDMTSTYDDVESTDGDAILSLDCDDCDDLGSPDGLQLRAEAPVANRQSWSSPIQLVSVFASVSTMRQASWIGPSEA